MKHTKKLKQKLSPQGPDIPIEQAISLLKEEVLEYVRGLSDGRIISVYKLTELGAELIKLESDLQLTLDAEKPMREPTEVVESDGTAIHADAF